MCFSATASFTAGGVLVPMSAYAVALARKKRQGRFLPLALVPLAFALQQIVEGFVWLSINGANLAAARTWSLGFLFFSHFFWPFFVPLMAFSAEEQPGRRRFLGALTIAGFVFGLLIYVPFLVNTGWFDPVVINCHIDYTTTVLMGALPTRILYAAIILVALFASSHRSIRIFGVIIALSIAITIVFWRYAFISVWCFFAAILSAYLIYIIWRLPSATGAKS